MKELKKEGQFFLDDNRFHTEEIKVMMITYYFLYYNIIPKQNEKMYKKNFKEKARSKTKLK